MADVNTEKLIEGLKAYFLTDKMVALVEAIKNGGILSKISKGIAIVMEGVQVVEKLAFDLSDMATGKQKKDALVKFLDDCIDLPFYLEPIDGVVIGMAIDGIVAYYNVKLGHGWLKVLKEFLL